MIESSLSNEHEKASFLAASAPHSGDWLLALPITACGLRLNDEAVRTAVALRLGTTLCVPHTSPCGTQVDAYAVHRYQPWQDGKQPLAWDVTVICPLAVS